ncbi:hypothetical protein QG37_00936 [Candidozyma auris]|uniref:Uncharacterized protein n=1 Tax=Candidozyma auris TaxID=498019 RepID=A0A0L0P6K3_CANAR|nr:hypothetical protein QG37_00936 [[Candida] auris]
MAAKKTVAHGSWVDQIHKGIQLTRRTHETMLSPEKKKRRVREERDQ